MPLLGSGPDATACNTDSEERPQPWDLTLPPERATSPSLSHQPLIAALPPLSSVESERDDLAPWSRGGRG